MIEMLEILFWMLKCNYTCGGGTNGWTEWLDRMVGLNGWIEWLDRMVGSNGWTEWLDRMVRSNGWAE